MGWRLPTYPTLTILVMIGPVVAGLIGTVLPALGYVPSLGLDVSPLDPFRDLIAWNGLSQAVFLSVFVGVVATILSVLCVTLIVAGWQGTALFRAILRLLSPFLSVPHAAAAFGLMFVISPSGWAFRIVAQIAGWDRPPDLLIVQDPWGLSLIAALVLKEVPFLFLMTLAALSQVKDKEAIRVAQSLGYSRVTAWLKCIFPLVYRQIRLPVFVVLTYSMSVVDVAIILGPNTPPTLSVQIVKWMSDPDLALRLQAAAAALLQLGLVLAALVGFRGLEVLVGFAGRSWIETGERGFLDPVLRLIGACLGYLNAIALVLCLLVLSVWAFAGFWSFPDLLPDQFTLRNWQRHQNNVWAAALDTFTIALAATLLGLIFVVGCLETEHRRKLRMGQTSTWLIYLPLLIPQTAILPGLQSFFLFFGLEMGRGPVIIAHLVFVLPYVFISLGDQFRAWDQRYGVIATTMGAIPRQTLWRVRLPMLLAPILTAGAVGFSVSVGQYLPTLLVGGGRVSTLSTEALALASGGDRRAIGVFGLVLTLAALLPFALALLVPSVLWKNRRGLRRD